MNGDDPDYASYSLADLLDVRERLDRVRFPDRYTAIAAEIERRELSGEVGRARQAEHEASVATKNRASGLFPFLVGVALFVFGVAEPVAFTLRSSDWPAIEAVAVHEKEKHWSETRLAYRYTIDGIRYTGRRLSSMGSDRKMRSWLSQYAHGVPVPCYVNPDNPEDSVLTRGWSVTPALAISVALILIGLINVRYPKEDEAEHPGN